MSRFLVNLARRGAGLTPVVAASPPVELDAVPGDGGAELEAAEAPGAASLFHAPVTSPGPAALAGGAPAMPAAPPAAPAVISAPAPPAPFVQRFVAPGGPPPGPAWAGVAAPASRPSAPAEGGGSRAALAPVPPLPPAVPAVWSEAGRARQSPAAAEAAGEGAIAPARARASRTSHEITEAAPADLAPPPRPAAMAEPRLPRWEADGAPSLPDEPLVRVARPEPAPRPESSLAGPVAKEAPHPFEAAPPPERVVHVRIGTIEIHDPRPAPTVVPAAPPAAAGLPAPGFERFAHLRSYAPWEG